jgi:hypothetical protein
MNQSAKATVYFNSACLRCVRDDSSLMSQPSQPGNFFFTATFFSVTYLGMPSRP